jgi:uncharacterized protein YcaQ
VAEVGAWHYSHIYEVTTRHFPNLQESAHAIKESEARAKLTELYFQSVGAAQLRDVHKLFGWKNELITRTITRLSKAGKLKQVEHPKQNGEWLALTELCDRSR